MVELKRNIKELFAGTQMTLVGIFLSSLEGSSGILFGFGVFLVAAGTATTTVALYR
jgi:hypothetical protein